MPPTNTEIQSSLDKLEEQVQHIALCVERIESNTKHITTNVGRLEDRTSKVESIINGNGKEGLASMVSTLWRERDKKIKVLGEILIGILLLILGAAVNWYFTVG